MRLYRYELECISISGNVSVSQRTKRVDIRNRFIQEFVLKEFLKTIFVKTEINCSDIFTRNLGGNLHERHSKKMIVETGI
mmetsp:Transcript_17141/g.22258  ORF Transcript_17141/g.22258 Transcript_17141/m.22258 type:complete len:80 (-) Transcript_17141:252-491(-)